MDRPNHQWLQGLKAAVAGETDPAERIRLEHKIILAEASERAGKPINRAE
jgi:hypothetical protein